MNKNITFTFILLLFSLQTFSQSPGWLWAKAKGGTDNDFGQGVTIDAAGNVYTVGSFMGTADFDPGIGVFNLTATGFYDIFISKLDASGNFIWAKQIGGTNFDYGQYTVMDGNIYITGNFQGTVDFDPGAGVFNLTSAGNSDEDIFIAKYDTAGSLIWANAMTGIGYGIGYSLAFDISGNIYTIGYFTQTIDFDPGPGTFNLTSNGNYDIFITQLDGTGNFIWAKQIGGAAFDYGNSIYVDGTGNVFTTGQFTGAVDFDPGTGTFNLTSIGSGDAFVLMLDNNGNLLWAKQMGGTNATGTSITLDAFSNILYTGYFYGTVDFDPDAGTFNLTSAGMSDIFISELDGSSGGFLWAKSFGALNDDWGLSIASNISNDVFTTGYFDGTVDFDPGAGTFNLTSAGSNDIFISKLNDLGNFVWAKATGGTMDDRGISITVNSSDNIYVAGSFSSSTILFDAITLINAGANDIFVAKTDNVITGIESIHNTDVFINSDLITTEVILNFDEVAPRIVRLFSSLGEILELTQTNSLSLSFNMSRYPKGIYFITVTEGNNMSIKKFVKM